MVTGTLSNIDKTAFGPFPLLFERSGLAITQVVQGLLPGLRDHDGRDHAVATLHNTCSPESLSIKWFGDGLCPSGRLRFSQPGRLSFFMEHKGKVSQEHKACEKSKHLRRKSGQRSYEEFYNIISHFLPGFESVS